MSGSLASQSASSLDRFQSLSGRDLISAMADAYRGRIAVTSSFGAESAVLLDLVAQVDKSMPVLFLDTNELFDETVVYRDQLVAHLGLTNLKILKADAAQLAEVEELWQTDPDRCCHVRKVVPLEQAAKGYAALIDGRKRAHGADRQNLPAVELSADGLVKIAPLWSWGEQEISAYFDQRGLPRHPLTAQGYRSIGCWPCTRPTNPGESPRAGRWAGSAKTECGIHKVNR